MTDQTEQDYLRAIKRIQSGNVSHPDLVKLAAHKRLKLTVSAVAKESGRSRTAIATDKSPYPEVRKAISAGQGPKGITGANAVALGSSVQFHLLQARGDIRDKSRAMRILGTQLVAAEKLIDDLKAKLAKAEEKAVRRRNETT